MAELLSYFTNRELAFIFWLIIFLILIIWYKKTRQPVISMIEIIFSKTILTSLLLMLVYIFLIICLLKKFDLWVVRQFKDTSFWFIGTAVVSLMNFNEAYREGYFKKKVIENLKFVLIFEFVINLYSFNLLTEIILIPLLVLIVGMITVAELQKKKEYELLLKILQGLLTIIGIVYLFHAVFIATIHFNEFATIPNLKDFTLHPLLTITFLPFIYLIALFSLYQNLFIRISCAIKHDKKAARLLKQKVFQECLLNLKKLNRFNRNMSVDLWQTESIDGVKSLINRFRETELDPSKLADESP